MGADKGIPTVFTCQNIQLTKLPWIAGLWVLLAKLLCTAEKSAQTPTGGTRRRARGAPWGDLQHGRPGLPPACCCRTVLKNTGALLGRGEGLGIQDLWGLGGWTAADLALEWPRDLPTITDALEVASTTHGFTPCVRMLTDFPLTRPFPFPLCPSCPNS